jgi:hypothetical protein
MVTLMPSQIWLADCALTHYPAPMRAGKCAYGRSSSTREHSRRIRRSTIVARQTTAVSRHSAKLHLIALLETPGCLIQEALWVLQKGLHGGSWTLVLDQSRLYSCVARPASCDPVEQGKYMSHPAGCSADMSAAHECNEAMREVSISLWMEP